ncbi:MAG: GrpB family protein [Ekhidna sp.]|nr:GrpB family protein [Ekhidna sp.]
MEKHLTSYQERWKIDFERISNILTSILDPVPCSIEHVGSTAIEGMAAKPIIDIDIVHYRPEEFESIKHSLEEIGYYHNGDQGIAGREVFKRNKDVEDQVLDTISHHLYVCRDSSDELQNHLRFRDYLRTTPQARQTYSNLKNALANKANQNKKIYAALKEIEARSFISDCIQKQIHNGQ